MSKTELNERYIRAVRALFDRKFSYLNDRQREAVFTVNGPLLVLAGAGTGKTTLLVSRVAYILGYGNAYMSVATPASLDEGAVEELEEAVRTTSDSDLDMLLSSFAAYPPKPWNVLAITFTNKAANEMKTRLASMLGDDVSDIWCGTFHSMCLRILRYNSSRFGWQSDFTIYDADDSKKLMQECLKQLGIDEKNLPAKTVLGHIGRAKDNLITPAEFDADVGSDYKLQQISSLYTLYQAKLSDAKAMDFDDIIMKTVLLLRENPDVLEKYQRQFKYVLVDEFQDTNHAQFELSRLLSGGYGNIMVVGDDDQSIYKFRGATIENILRFDEKISGTKIIKLEENYRSTSNILGAANSVIKNNFGRRGKELWTSRGEGEKVLFKHVENYMDEGRFIVNRIHELIVRERRRYSDFAVLYRTNAQSNAIENALSRSAVPYRVLGNLRFYERKEIKDVLAYLCVINNPDDSLRLRRIINEPKRKIGDATISAVELLADNEGRSMFYIMEHANDYTALSKSASKFSSFVDMIKTLRDLADKMPLSQLIDKMLDLSGYRAMLYEAELNGESTDRRENVEEFISNAVEYEQTHDEPTLSSFLEEIALIADIDNYDTEADAVVLMTIHSAKGLEFPVVFIPGMEEGLFPSQQSALSPDELEEERRLAYVAITRAKERLFLICSRERLMYGHTVYGVRSRFIGEINPEYMTEDVPKARVRQTPPDTRRRPVKISNELLSRSAVSKNVGKTQNIESFSVGDRVRHITFGTGTVLSAKEMGADILYEIAFDIAGTKKLMATYAKLKKE